MLLYFSSMCESNPDLQEHISQQTQTDQKQDMSSSSVDLVEVKTSDLLEYDPCYQLMIFCLTRHAFHAWYMVDFDIDPVIKLKCVLWICMEMLLCVRFF